MTLEPDLLNDQEREIREDGQVSIGAVPVRRIRDGWGRSGPGSC